MKITIQRITQGEEEMILRCREITPEMENIIRLAKREPDQIFGRADGRQYRISPFEVYYFECVDEKLFACTQRQVLQISMTLAEAEKRFRQFGFFRCNKSMVMNINKVFSVTSEMGNRINAQLDNGEHIIISRRYAREFREILKRGDGNRG